MENIQDTLSVPHIDGNNTRHFEFNIIENNEIEIDFGEMIIGPYSYTQSLESFIEIYFNQVAIINEYPRDNIKNLLANINTKTKKDLSSRVSYLPEEINYILSII